MSYNKTTNILLFSLLFTVLHVVSCRPEPIQPLTPSENGSASKLIGTWKGVAVNQRDIGAENKNFPYKNLDITAPLQFTNVKLTLNGTNRGNFTFDYGTAPAFFKFSTGNWSVDDSTKVGKLYLVNGTDSMVMDIGSYNFLLQNKMQLKQTKTLIGRPAIVYEFLFSK
ncbi:MAG: hypothetical protein ACK5G0_03715 [Bacteroidota bacterium]|jgi:hypothetical protein